PSRGRWACPRPPRRAPLEITRARRSFSRTFLGTRADRSHLLVVVRKCKPQPPPSPTSASALEHKTTRRSERPSSALPPREAIRSTFGTPRRRALGRSLVTSYDVSGTTLAQATSAS